MREVTDYDDRVFEARQTALAAAVRSVPARDVLATAGLWTRWLLKPATRLVVHVSPDTFTLGGQSHHPTKYTDLGGGQVAVTIQDNEYVTLTIDPEDAAGNPASDAGPFTWAADQGSLVSLVPSVDGTQVNVGAVGPLGTANITVTDANGIVSPADPVTVVSGPASQLGVSAGTPAAIPSTGVPVPAGASSSS